MSADADLLIHLVLSLVSEKDDVAVLRLNERCFAEVCILLSPARICTGCLLYACMCPD